MHSSLFRGIEVLRIQNISLHIQDLGAAWTDFLLDPERITWLARLVEGSPVDLISVVFQRNLLQDKRIDRRWEWCIKYHTFFTEQEIYGFPGYVEKEFL